MAIAAHCCDPQIGPTEINANRKIGHRREE
jgi:hypothetical protein